MGQHTDTATLKKEIAALERQTSLRVAILAVAFFVVLGTFFELLFTALIDKMPLQEVFQEFRWAKLFFMAGFWLLFWYFVLMRKQKKLLQQKKAELLNTSL